MRAPVASPAIPIQTRVTLTYPSYSLQINLPTLDHVWIFRAFRQAQSASPSSRPVPSPPASNPGNLVSKLRDVVEGQF